MADNKKKSLMIVDDDTDILFTIESIFQRRGFEVFKAQSGDECLEHLENGFLGIILMDVMMPRMNGWEAIKQIVERGYSDKVIISMLTAKDAPDPDLDYLKEYVIDYITKPFEPQELVALVDDYLSLL